MKSKYKYYYTPGGARRIRQDLVPSRRPKPQTPEEERAWLDRARKKEILATVIGVGALSGVLWMYAMCWIGLL